MIILLVLVWISLQHQLELLTLHESGSFENRQHKIWEKILRLLGYIFFAHIWNYSISQKWSCCTQYNAHCAIVTLRTLQKNTQEPDRQCEKYRGLSCADRFSDKVRSDHGWQKQAVEILQTAKREPTSNWKRHSSRRKKEIMKTWQKPTNIPSKRSNRSQTKETKVVTGNSPWSLHCFKVVSDIDLSCSEINWEPNKFFG